VPVIDVAALRPDTTQVVLVAGLLAEIGMAIAAALSADLRSAFAGSHRGGSAEAALSAQGRRLLVVDPVEVNVDLVRHVTEIVTSLCARLYGRRAASNRAARLLAVAPEPEPEAVS
jgi:hypothetical protein